ASWSWWKTWTMCAAWSMWTTSSPVRSRPAMSQWSTVTRYSDDVGTGQPGRHDAHSRAGSTGRASANFGGFGASGASVVPDGTGTMATIGKAIGDPPRLPWNVTPGPNVNAPPSVATIR